MNTILIILIFVIIYLISTTSPKKEKFSFFDDLARASNPNMATTQAIDCSGVNMALCDLPFSGIRDKCPTECAKGTNSIAQCREWAFGPSNECAANRGYMMSMCKKQCDEKETADKYAANEIDRIRNSIPIDLLR